MHKMIEELHELCEILEKVLRKTNEKLRASGGDPSASDMEYIDWLTHSIKSVKSSIAMIEREGGGYSQAGNWEARGRFGDMYSQRDEYNDGGNSYAKQGEHWVRGHYSNADGMRGDGRSYADGRSKMMEYLEKALDSADERDREDIRRFMRKLETA